MRLARVARMTLPEVLGRGRQEILKGLERLGMAAPPDFSSARPGAPLHAFLEGAAARFFEGATSEATPALVARRFPHARDAVLEAAESLCRGRFDLLGYRGLSFGEAIDWHLDPVAGRRAPRVHWSRLDPLDPVQVGDSKVVWELNRHQWFVRLGQAYRFTGAERYAAAFARAVHAWLEANPPGQGINWASSLEVALRIVSWCWALVLFRDAPGLSPALFDAMAASLGAHAAHVERYLSRYFSPNTHLTGEALGLFYAGIMLPGLPGAARWRDLGRRVLVEECARQVLPDGVHFERSTCYHRYTLEIYLHFALLAARSGVPVPRDVVERLPRMLDFLLAVREPDGAVPSIGDDDGGVLLPLAVRARGDVRGLFALAAAMFGRSEYAWAAGGDAPEAAWMLGPCGLDALAATPPRPPDDAGWRLFPHGGFAVMRSGRDTDAHQLVLDVGPLGCHVSAGHGHADLLGVQLVAFGEPFVVDPGTFCYTADAAWRDAFRSTAAHSTVMVDGLDQATPRGPFAWRERPAARGRLGQRRAGRVVAEGLHAAYARLPDPVTHRRRIWWTGGAWVIVDDLGGTAEHALELRFQFAPLEVVLEPSGWVRARGQRGRALLVRAFGPAPLAARIDTGQTGPVRGWVSPEYGRRRPAPLLTFAARARLPLRLATLLVPVADPDAKAPEVVPRVDAGGELTALDVHGEESVVLGEEAEAVVVGPPARGW